MSMVWHLLWVCDREMKDLHALLQGNDRVAIVAVEMGGVENTTLARRYVMQHRSDSHRSTSVQ